MNSASEWGVAHWFDPANKVSFNTEEVMNFDSNKNQEIKRDFVNREVYACISDMAEYLFGFDCGEEKYATYDEFDNYEPDNLCPKCREYIEESYEDLESEDGRHPCPHCGHDIDWFDEEWPEIYEYWLVSSWLGEKLKNKGEVVLGRRGSWVWGRQCTGQAILLDGVISRICNDLGMLVEEEAS